MRKIFSKKWGNFLETLMEDFLTKGGVDSKKIEMTHFTLMSDELERPSVNSYQLSRMIDDLLFKMCFFDDELTKE